jgi:hypothetical protein
MSNKKKKRKLKKTRSKASGDAATLTARDAKLFLALNLIKRYHPIEGDPCGAVIDAALELFEEPGV